VPATYIHAGFLLGLFFDAEDEATCTPETSVDFQRITRRSSREDNTLHLKYCLYLNPYLLLNYTLRGGDYSGFRRVGEFYM
jgi:hypothetical protein